MGNKEEFQEAVEAASFIRSQELDANPIKGSFDKAHLLKIHGYLFQDAPKIDAEYSKEFVRPGEFRPAADAWAKGRDLGNGQPVYRVYYSGSENPEEDLDKTLKAFGGANALKGLDREQFAERMAQLYGDLDYIHPFREGNSRTLRTFTRQLAHEAGFDLDWHTTNADAKTRDALYIARDKEVTNHRMPELQKGRVDGEEDFKIYLSLYKRNENSPSLKDIIQSSLQPSRHIEKDVKVRTAEKRRDSSNDREDSR